MKIEDFVAGTKIQQYQYKSFIPERINHSFRWDDPKINVLLSEANRKLGELNAFSLFVSDIDLFIKMLIIKESVSSSRLEGSKIEIDEVMMKETDIDPAKTNDWKEIQNYIIAMNESIEEMKNIPLSSRILNMAHEILLDSPRGEKKTPGEFRKSQNWVGGSSLKEALFIPPIHGEISGLMGDLENFIHNNYLEIPDLIRIAIAHYQFETIQPYLDGNGRIGRLLITFYLEYSGLLAKPTLYLSSYFEKNRFHYFNFQTMAREKNDLAQWIIFFLESVIKTATHGIKTFQSILELKKEFEKEVLPNFGKKTILASKLMMQLYKKPYINCSTASAELGITPTTANSLINDFIDKGILEKISGDKRNRVFVFKKYLQLFKNNTY
ncbi:MAG: Fic family protein [Melioribacteraceae bacterium]